MTCASSRPLGQVARRGRPARAPPCTRRRHGRRAHGPDSPRPPPAHHLRPEADVGQPCRGRLREVPVPVEGDDPLVAADLAGHRGGHPRARADIQDPLTGLEIQLVQQRGGQAHHRGHRRDRRPRPSPVRPAEERLPVVLDEHTGPAVQHPLEFLTVLRHCPVQQVPARRLLSVSGAPHIGLRHQHLPGQDQQRLAHGSSLEIARCLKACHHLRSRGGTVRRHRCGMPCRGGNRAPFGTGACLLRAAGRRGVRPVHAAPLSSRRRASASRWSRASSWRPWSSRAKDVGPPGAGSRDASRRATRCQCACGIALPSSR